MSRQQEGWREGWRHGGREGGGIHEQSVSPVSFPDASTGLAEGGFKRAQLKVKESSPLSPFPTPQVCKEAGQVGTALMEEGPRGRHPPCPGGGRLPALLAQSGGAQLCTGGLGQKRRQPGVRSETLHFT